MPRNASGVYTLPEAAFVSGTVIQSAPVNSDLSDIASALTLSVASTGVTTLTGPLKAASGSVTAPSYTFGSATGTGFYLSAANEFSWTAVGVLQATFAATGAVTWIGSQTFQGSVTFNGSIISALSLTNTLSIVTGTEPAVTIRNSDNDASEHELTRYALGSGVGATASRRIIGSGANDVTEIRDYVGATEILRQTASLVSPKKNISLDAGITVIATAGYVELTQITTPTSAAVSKNKIYVKSGENLYINNSDGSEIQVSLYVQRVYSEFITASVSITASIPIDGTIPQNTEGQEVITATITPKKTTNRIRIRFMGNITTNILGFYIAYALFQDSIANALKAQALGLVGASGTVFDDTVKYFPMLLEYEHSPGTTSAVTYKIRIGAQGTVAYVNELFGGATGLTLILEEINV